MAANALVRQDRIADETQTDQANHDCNNVSSEPVGALVISTNMLLVWIAIRRIDVINDSVCVFFP